MLLTALDLDDHAEFDALEAEKAALAKELQEMQQEQVLQDNKEVEN